MKRTKNKTKKIKTVRGFEISRLFNNNRFVLLFSVLVSLVLWAVMVSTNTEEHARAITGIPVSVTLSDAAQADGLKVFSQSSKTATAYIKGNSLVVNQVSAADLTADASLASTVTSPGDYTLPLQIKKNNSTLSNFNVSIINPEQILVSVDRYKEKTFTIQNNISYSKDYKSDPSYFIGTPTLSSDTVTVSGAEKRVTQVNKVAYDYEVTDTLTEPKSFTASLILYDANGNKIETGDDLQVSPAQVDVTIPVLSKQTFSLKAVFTNAPSGIALNSGFVTVDPGTVDVAGPPDVLSTMSSISLDAIDFSTVSPENNVFSVGVDIPSSCKNLSNLTTATVTLDMSSMAKRSIQVTDIQVKNLAENLQASVSTKSINVTVIGPDSELGMLTSNNLSATIDMSDVSDFTGSTEKPAAISLSGTSRSWVYGSYSATVSVSSKSGG